MKNIKSKIFVIAGEQSGDMNAAGLIKKLYALNNNLLVKGIGGDYLKSVNTELLYDYSSLNFVGFSAVIKNYLGIRNILNSCTEFIKSYKPSVILLVDFPGFNLKFAKKIKKFYEGKIIYYISPQIWAWHKSRVNLIKKYIDKMLVILPFEVDFYKNEGLNVFYAGNPLLENTDNFLKNAVKEKNENPVISLMPGSRKEEFDRIFPHLADAVPELKNKFNAKIKLIRSKNISLTGFENILGKLKIQVISPESETEKYKLILNSDLVITKFGTSSTECAFIGTPFISVYKANKINYLVAMKLIKLKYVTMVNIISGKQIVREFIQSDLTTGNIIGESENILKDKIYRDRMTEEFRNVKEIFYKTKIKEPPESIINEYLI
ncbi:MAG: lipid-A-disaccharide synthase [Ignavibacteria bacterium]|nr:lipid-A-disaccharide synthase [Ignavibacteria bacterium]